MSAALLREAAAKMRERAEAAATGYDWKAKAHSSRRDCVTVQDAGGTFLAFYCRQSFADHASAWHPAVALAVADWLDKSAETYERLEDDLRGLEGLPTIEQVYGYDFTEAITVARAYLGAGA